MDRKLLKQNAKNSFKKKWFESAIVALIMGVFAGGTSNSFRSVAESSDPTYQYEGSSLGELFSMIPTEILHSVVAVMGATAVVFTIAGIFLAPIFTVGGNRYFLKLRKGVNTDIGEVTGNFKDGNYWNIVVISFVQGLKIALWFCLLFIPGIVKFYEYFLIEHILAVRPDINSKEAFQLSKKLMDGHKMDAFVLGLSFMGWNILSLFTFGILNIVYVNPYMYATFNEFYCYVRAEGIRNGIITPMDLPDYEAPMQYGYDTNNGFGFNPQQPAFDGGFQNQYQAPQEAQQTPFWQESNQPVGNVETMPNEEPVTENDATEVDFKPVDEE